MKNNESLNWAYLKENLGCRSGQRIGPTIGQRIGPNDANNWANNWTVLGKQLGQQIEPAVSIFWAAIYRILHKYRVGYHKTKINE